MASEFGLPLIVTRSRKPWTRDVVQVRVAYSRVFILPIRGIDGLGQLYVASLVDARRILCCFVIIELENFGVTIHWFSVSNQTLPLKKGFFVDQAHALHVSLDTIINSGWFPSSNRIGDNERSDTVT
ncbi:hypothetical protein SCLCIDRAFT_25701 [Scleroderma citrinum Foug A]|uniref:Uncharacterized protein n=1 Tax=Scleroderma citrinum Foug A TaxID=1036808 RepID=A0A0C3AA19_9AGAM|nr:hypothetical protein SCLCIDRAFT_25701 [Scleroderma citrinum Foug A]